LTSVYRRHVRHSLRSRLLFVMPVQALRDLSNLLQEQAVISP
jgi:hypothetical protein